MGAQARQAARAEPAAARRDRHELSSARRRDRGRSRRRPLRHHARRRHAAAERRGAEAGRHDGAPAQPAALRSRGGPRRRRLRPAPAAGDAPRCRRTARDRSTSASSRVRRASIRTPRRSRTSTRTSSARAPTPARASTTSTRSRRRSPDRVPENTLLSHDLFEGIFARAGLVTDVELFEDFPSHYEAAAARQHRWARGDWQLLPWIVGSGPCADLPVIGRWKMLDNLRRTLSAPAAFLTARRRLDRCRSARPPCGRRSCSRRIVLRRPGAGPARRSCRSGSGISKRSHVRAVACRPRRSPARRWRSRSRCSRTRRG